MAQYVVFLALFPLALFGTVLANLLPRMWHSYHRFVWLRYFNYLQLGFLICNLTELLSRNSALKQSLAAADYLFLGYGAVVWLFFALEYTSSLRRFKPWQPLLFVIPALTAAFGLANGNDGLVWRKLTFVQIGWIRAMKTSGYGPMAWGTILQSYALTLLGAFILLQHSISTHKLFRRQTSWMLAGVLLPFTANLLFVLKLIPDWNKDYSALMAALGGLCFSIGCLRYRLFTVVPVSRQTQFQYMRLGLVVIDAEGCIVDLNSAACRMIGKSEIHLLGSPANVILDALSDRYEMTRNPIVGEDGRVETWHIELREGDSDAGFESPTRAQEEDAILTLGELRVLEMLARNLSNKEISERLGISLSTVKFHLSNAFRKTGASNRADLLRRTANILNQKPV
jgi:DNA-binding CsgD family transcriptional regulator